MTRSKTQFGTRTTTFSGGIRWLACAWLLACGGSHDDGASDAAADSGHLLDARTAGEPDTGAPVDVGDRALRDAGPSAAGAGPGFSRAGYVEDLTFVTGERVPGSAHWQEVQDACAQRFEQLGLDVETATYATGTNVLGTLLGTSKPDELVIVGAHYDHIEGCPGADDNATGVAGVLQLAHMLLTEEHERTLVLACWDEEERGLLGSTAHAQALAERGATVSVAYSLEMIGYVSDEPDSQQVPAGFELAFPDQVAAVQANGSRGDFIALIANEGAVPAMDAASAAAARIGLDVVALPATAALGPLLAAVVRSDHASFWAQGAPGLMVTDTANFRNPAYHCQGGLDTVDALDHDFSGQVITAVAESVRAQLRAQ